ncbi:hypothetical protein C2E23DRAFT_93273 [Lenzites betulinus]|nr:hypothetical protein C2E23DRAFT_93273 [Lenzites betulinus]
MSTLRHAPQMLRPQQNQQQQTPVSRFVFRPMSQEVFQIAYPAWLEEFPSLDTSLLVLDNRTIDLWKLHCGVILAGGITRVIAFDLWPVISAQLGFVDLVADGPALAYHIQRVYRDFLFIFDCGYYRMMVKRYQEWQRALPRAPDKAPEESLDERVSE